MPLEHGKSKKAFDHNLKTEMHEGKPMNQSLAIAYAMKRKAKKMADGGRALPTGDTGHPPVQDPKPYDQSMANGWKNIKAVIGKAEGGEVLFHSPAGGSSNRATGAKRHRDEGSHEGVHRSKSVQTPGESGMGYSVRAGDYESAKKQHYQTRKESRNINPNVKGLAEGGMMTHDGYESSRSGPHQDEFHQAHPQAEYDVMHEGDHKRPNHMAIEEDDRMLNQHGDHEEGPYGHDTMKEDEPHHMAEGGMMSPMHGEQDEAHEEDMVGRIMKQRECMYSEGGRVANDTPITAGFESNNFDDLVKRDDLEFSYTGKNSGDELGDKAEDHDRHDMVDRIMMKRFKQRNPYPA